MKQQLIFTGEYYFKLLFKNYNMENLFYSHDEKILFYISGYSDTTNVKSQISMLQNNYNHMQRISGGVKDISSYEILKSSRYKSMRVFYCKVEVPPDNAFVIGNDKNKWTMHEWIHN